METDPAPPNFSAAPEPVDPRWKIVDAAAKKSDRWWMFTLLMLVIGLLLYDHYAAGKQIDYLRGEIDSVRKDQLGYLTAKNEAMMMALSNNTRALEANTNVLSRIERKQ